jgi:hypothetical protein
MSCILRSHRILTPLTKPVKHLLFRSPLLKGKGIKKALAWNREQLLDLWRLWELCRQRCVKAGLIPMTQPPTMISDDALAVGNSENIATVTLLSSQTPHLTSLLDSQCAGPFSPMAWRGLTSIIRRPQHWQVASSRPLKTTKMPLRFRQPMTTEGRLLRLVGRSVRCARGWGNPEVNNE